MKKLFLSVLAFGMSACTSTIGNEPSSENDDKKPLPVNANVISAEGKSVHGVLAFRDTPQGLHITGTVTGLSSNALHGFHIHENRGCALPTFTSAGGHFNPTKESHGDLGKGSHAGDLGNIQSDSEGSAIVDVTTPFLFVEKNLSNEKNSFTVKGKTVVFHAKKDDLKTQPSGDSGDRIACVEIK